MRGLLYRALALALGAYLALSLCRAAQGCRIEAGTNRALRADLASAGLELEALAKESAMTDREFRRLAFRQWGLAAGEDVVFFDAGAAVERPKEKEEENFVWSLR